MTKFQFFCLIFFLLCGPISALASYQQDTSVTVNQDTTTVVLQKSVSGDFVTYDSLELPVPDSSFLFPVHIREVSEKQVNRYKNNREYAYANDSAYWRKDPPQEPNLLFRVLFSRPLRWVILSFIAGLILIGIYQLVMENNFTLLFKSRKYRADLSEQSLPGEKIDFEEGIRFNQMEGNYRMAIRFLYLRLIHDLKEKSGISFRESSTNSEIARAMGTHPEAANFKWLATAYEYVYYGEFVPDRETFLIIRNRFEALQKTFIN
jgi:hypothetical protein